MANVIKRAMFGNRARVAEWLAAAWLLMAMLMGSGCMQAHAALRSEEATIKAAYLYKFGSFIEWPEQAFDRNGAFTIGVIGADLVAEELERMVGSRSVNGRPVAVRRLRPEERLADVNVLFIGRSHNSHLREILTTAGSEPVLTVTEAETGLALGSIINFVVIDGKLRFDVAPKAAGTKKLAISARLLAAARKVEMGT
jgi:hypothetical protein